MHFQFRCYRTPLYQAVLSDAKFHAQLLVFDRDLSAAARAVGCRRCGRDFQRQWTEAVPVPAHQRPGWKTTADSSRDGNSRYRQTKSPDLPSAA
jgi:hypothetical protein